MIVDDFFLSLPGRLLQIPTRTDGTAGAFLLGSQLEDVVLPICATALTGDGYSVHDMVLVLTGTGLFWDTWTFLRPATHSRL